MIGNYKESMCYIEDSEQLEEAKSLNPADEEEAKIRVQTLADNLILNDKLT